jgi:UDP:flavonoid glycosyltransferase YjiC (YdhE family)
VRVTLLTVGSRGDVQPIVAFGVALQEAGHRVRLATHRRYGSLVTHHGLELASLEEGHVSRGAETHEGRRWIEARSRRLPAAVGFLRDARSVARRRLADAAGACDDADAIVAANLAIVLGWQVARAGRVPLVRAYVEPPVWMITQRSTRRLAPVVRQAAWLAARPWLNAVRRDALGWGPVGRREPLADLDRRREPALFAFSPAVLPAPPRLGDWYQVTGYWFLQGTDDPAPPPVLRDFLAAGPPPVAIGFGTMIDTDQAATVRLVAEALARAGQRGVLIGGPKHDEPAALQPHLLAVGPTDHQWLYTRCSAAVHYASVGTTAAALRAGIPSVPIPHMTDQFLWARRVHELGVGPAPIRRRELTVERLADAIHAATGDAGIRRRAVALGEQIRVENGVARAVEAFERRVAGRQSTHVSQLTSVP